MSATLSNSLADHLSARGFGAQGSSLFVDQFPPAPSVGVMVTDTSGTATYRPRGDFQRTFSIVVYHTDHDTASGMAWGIYYLLNQTGHLRLNIADSVTDIKANQTPYSRGMDESRRWRFACNYRVQLVAKPKCHHYAFAGIAESADSVSSTVAAHVVATLSVKEESDSTIGFITT